MLPEEEIGLPGKFGLMAGKNSTEVSSDLKHYWYALYGNFSYRINLSFWLRIQPEFGAGFFASWLEESYLWLQF